MIVFDIDINKQILCRLGLVSEEVYLRPLSKECLTPFLTPKIIPQSPSRELAVTALAQAILGEEEARIIKTPIEQVMFTRDNLAHMVAKTENARERYANFIIPALENPLEIWLTQFTDGTLRPQYIALFDKPKTLLISTVDKNGVVLYNFMNSKIADMNRNRMGILAWKSY